jgi:hypothetical protein
MKTTNSETRAALLSSWDAARRQADRNGAIVLNAASFAGYLLAVGGTVAGAQALIPKADGSLFYARVHAALSAVEHEEHSAARVSA